MMMKPGRLGKLVQVACADFGRTLSDRAPRTLLSAACLSAYNFNERDGEACERILRVDEHFADRAFEFVSRLTRETLTCRSCGRRLHFDQKQADLLYCQCRHGRAPHSDLEGWRPFIERPSTLVWRKEALKGLYAYKSKVVEQTMSLEI